jgi:C_GCAxxG_C_C family probable redox protein
MQKSKAEILAALIQVRREIIESISCLPEPRQTQVFLGEWSLKDLLAHFAGWDYANLESISALQAGRLPEFYAFYDKDWRSYNARLVANCQDETFEALLGRAAASRQALQEALASLPEAEFQRDAGVRFKGVKVTLARLLEAETKDESVHLEQILAFLDPAERAESLFLGGFNCSQSVLQAVAPRLGLPQAVAARLASPFGAGIAFQGQQCGAVSGALLAIGLRYGNQSAEDKTSKELAYVRSQEFIARFTARRQTTLCRELLGIDLSQPGEYERARQEGVFDEICPGFVREAAEILSAMLDEP